MDFLTFEEKLNKYVYLKAFAKELQLKDEPEKSKQDLWNYVNSSAIQQNGNETNISMPSDFWRIFNKKLIEEHKIICLAEKDFESRDYLLIERMLESIIDSFIKTFMELDNHAK